MEVGGQPKEVCSFLPQCESRELKKVRFWSLAVRTFACKGISPIHIQYFQSILILTKNHACHSQQNFQRHYLQNMQTKLFILKGSVHEPITSFCVLATTLNEKHWLQIHDMCVRFAVYTIFIRFLSCRRKRHQWYPATMQTAPTNVTKEK